ncbi:hypothetical protein KUL25_08770 [Rhodobacteraceae bacterium N5(2021)]|uniref:Uncharacterized protein n=1 Tax=Gymnodinialimonas phycosphaerae TaxID=2841589 RepID=A0A975TY42_9RHOB|nr:hypothetical protein [Gymnodinialimonas phycosphaerae]MBY4892854.1 hypothetical protein [Gymnodinialimonas phycosphaerae]
MSAPDTNVEKQARRHKGSFWGLAIALFVAAIVAFYFLGWTNVPDEEQAAPATVVPATD